MASVRRRAAGAGEGGGRRASTIRRSSLVKLMAVEDELKGEQPARVRQKDFFAHAGSMLSKGRANPTRACSTIALIQAVAYALL